MKAKADGSNRQGTDKQKEDVTKTEVATKKIVCQYTFLLLLLGDCPARRQKETRAGADDLQATYEGESC